MQRVSGFHPGTIVVVMASITVLGGCVGQASVPATPLSTFVPPSVAPTHPVATPFGVVPRFEPTPCPFDAEQTPGYAVDCGDVVVPEFHSDPAGPIVRLAVARFRSQASKPVPDPVVYLAGGPGGPGLISGFTAQLAYNFTPTQDFIAFDQRGVGHSEPSLTCPELTQQTRQELTQNESATDELAHEVAARFRCRDRLQSQGIHLTAYNTTESAADVNDIRMALGYDRVILLGASYGTRLALTVMRDSPEIVRSVVLDSVEPPQANEVEDLFSNADRALNLAFQGCVASTACQIDVPTLQADFNEAVKNLNAHPMTLPAVVLTGDRFSSQVVYLLSDRMRLGSLPALIEAAKRGDETYVRKALSYYGNIGTIGNSTGMSTSVVCNDVLPFNSRDRTIGAAHSVPPGVSASVLPLALSYFAMCAGWPANPPDSRNYQAVQSDLPTLILESANDPATPPANGQLAARTLPKSFYVETPGVGHTVIGTACGMQLITDFVGDPTKKPDASCTARMSITFVPTS
ncbi:MAG: alpha/beta fold hydrolase [Thermomicrobiales bacterium]